MKQILTVFGAAVLALSLGLGIGTSAAATEPHKQILAAGDNEITDNQEVSVEVIANLETNLGDLDFGGTHFFHDDGVDAPVKLEGDDIPDFALVTNDQEATLSIYDAWVHLSTLQVVNVHNDGYRPLELVAINILDDEGNPVPEAHLSNYGIAYNMYEGALHGGFVYNTDTEPFFFSIGDQIAPGEMVYGILSAHVQDGAEDGETYQFTIELEWDEVYFIQGLTGEVNCQLLPGVTLTAYLNDVPVEDAVSDSAGNYTLAVTQTGEYEVVATKDGFRDETRWINVEDLEQEYALNFVGNHGLIPNVLDGPYFAACMSTYLHAEGEFALSGPKFAAIMSAYLNPIEEE